MMLVDFNGVQMDVESLAPSERKDLEAANRRMANIERRDGVWVLLAAGVFAVCFGVSCLFFVDLKHLPGSFFEYLLYSVIPAIPTAYIVAARNNSKTLDDAGAIETMLWSKKGGPCVALIRERVMRSPLLARKLERAFANADVAIAAP